MELVKSLWQQLQESNRTYKPLCLEELKNALENICLNRKKPVNYLPAVFVLNMDDETFKSFMKTKNNYIITCNLEQHELIQKRINESNK
jgi:hypothetical protein